MLSNVPESRFSIEFLMLHCEGDFVYVVRGRLSQTAASRPQRPEPNVQKQASGGAVWHHKKMLQKGIGNEQKRGFVLGEFEPQGSDVGKDATGPSSVL